MEVAKIVGRKLLRGNSLRANVKNVHEIAQSLSVLIEMGISP
jgi:hypothetical protein